MTTAIQIGQTDTAVAQFFDTAGAEVILDHAVTWAATPSGKVTITPTANQVASVLGVAAQTGVIITATDPNQPFTASLTFTVTALPVAPDPVPPPIQPPPPVFPRPSPQPSPNPPPVNSVPDDDTQNPGAGPEASGGDGGGTDSQSGDGCLWWGPGGDVPPYFPLHPTLGYVPPVIPVDNAPPAFVMRVYDNGFIGSGRQ